jgi:RNA polymerase sigma-70 factor (ECF subfamily)
MRKYVTELLNQSTKDFEVLHETYRARVVRYLTRFVGKHEAEDLTQEIFAKVARGLGGVRGESKLSSWIYRIATDTAFDRLRSSSFRQAAVGMQWSEPSADCDECGGDADCLCSEITGERDSTERQFIRQKMNVCIRGEVETLPEPYRTVLALSELAELKNAEIAEIEGVSLETVKIRLHRARARLRKGLEKRCDFYRDENNGLMCDQKDSRSSSS